MSSQYPDTPSHGDKCFAFVIPVRHPKGKKVHDYRTIETLLESTVRSLLNQTHRNVVVVVVGHTTPRWAAEYDDRLRFLDVSNDEVFGPDKNHVTIDKGLKYVIGALYVMSVFDPALIMLLDADDYVHVELADRLLANHRTSDDLDGYMIREGVHVGVHVDEKHKTRYQFAVLVDEFDFSCGSCRIFEATRLRKRILEIDAKIEDRFSIWPEPDYRRSLRVPHDLIEWLAQATEGTRDDDDHIVNLLGRHTNQRRYFDFRNLDFVGAAKGCGHGNHDGPRRGAVHWYRVTGRLPLKTFLRSFGLPRQRWSFSYLSMLRTRTADKRAGNVWSDS